MVPIRRADRVNFTISGENRARLQVLFAGLLLIGLIAAVATAMVRSSPGGGDTQGDANGTGTAIALTSEALLGPFPTATAPSATASDIPSATPLPTLTPTRTPTLTASAVVIVTLTERTSLPRPTFTQTRVPTRTPVPPTSTPRPTRTNTPRPPATTPAYP
jgi:hypothetical protein